MNIGIIILIIIIFLFVVGVIGYIIYLNRKRPEGTLEKNLPIVVNFNSSRAEGHAVLLEKEPIPGPGGKILAKIYPIDLHHSDDPEKDESIKRTKIIEMPFMDKYRKVLPRGTLSTHRDIIFYLPTDPNEIQDSLKGTLIGDLLQKLSVYALIEQRVVKMYAEGIISQEQIIEMINIGELSKYFEPPEKVVKKIVSDVLKEMEKK